jgi:membrane protease YdiL (CAAX protease family)
VKKQFLISSSRLSRIKDYLQVDRYPAAGKPDSQTIFIFVSALILLNVFWYFGRSNYFNENLTNLFEAGDYSRLYPFFYFALSAFFYRTVIPVFLIYLVLKKRPRDFGYRFFGTFELWYVYLILFLLVIPVVYLAGYGRSFQDTYPMSAGIIVAGHVTWTKFLVYQLFYGLIFISGESFWRGYILFGLERKLGYSAIFVMLFPYVMSHYGKPFPETIGAILTGTVLGYLALRHRSFWLGVITHWSVAIWMDLVAMHFKGAEFW